MIGGGHPVLIQSMTNTKTEDVAATVAQILTLEKAGCQIIRCAVPTMEAARALGEIKKQIHIPLVADIHFDYKLATAADGKRCGQDTYHPGKYRKPGTHPGLWLWWRKTPDSDPCRCKQRSLEKELVEKYHGVTAEGLVESALDKVKIIEDMGYDQLVISIKSSDVLMCAKAHELIAQKTDYPVPCGNH